MYQIIESPGGFLEDVISRHPTRLDAEEALRRMAHWGCYWESSGEVWINGRFYAVCYRLW